jgi:hypothetical protein
VQPLLYALAACTLVTLANPVGLRLWTYPLPYLFSGTPDIRVIQEWQSVDFHDPLKLVFAAALWGVGIVGLGRPVTRAARQRFRLRLRARFDLIDVTLLVFATTMGLRYGRLVPLYGMLVLPLLGEVVARTWPPLSRRAELVAIDRSVARPFDYVLACVVVALFGALLVRAPDAQLGLRPRTDARFPYPVGAVTFLEGVASLGAPPRVFNEYAWGGYLLYRLYPRATVFIDGRADLYRDRIFDEYGTIHELAPTYRDALASSGSDFVLMPPDSLLTTALGTDAGWRRVFADKVAVVFQRAMP